MPATEQTWHDQRLMHRIFAVSGVLLLGSTIWMFLADHTREWKEHQRTFRGIEIQTTKWRELQFQTDQAEREHQELSTALLQAQSRPLDQELLAQFKGEVNADAKDRGVAEYSFGEIDQLAGRLDRLAAEAAAAREQAEAAYGAAQQAENRALEAQAEADQARAAIIAAQDRQQAQEVWQQKKEEAATAVAAAETSRKDAREADEAATKAEERAKAARNQLIERIQLIVNAARFRENLAVTKRKFRSADVDAAKAALGLALRDERSERILKQSQQEINRLVAGSVDQPGLVGLTLTYEETNAHRKQLQQILDQLTQEVDQLQKQVTDNRAELERLQHSTVERRSTYFTSTFPWLGKKWLELPILDAFNSPLKIDNLWDEDNKIDYNFSRVRRFDRCTTCHQAMQKTMPGSAIDPAFVHEQYLEFILRTPKEDELPPLRVGSDGKPRDLTVEDVYGIRLAENDEYLLNRGDVVISFVQPYASDNPASSLGAQAILAPKPDHQQSENGMLLRQSVFQTAGSDNANEVAGVRNGLAVGDVLVQVNDDVVKSRGSAVQLLLTGRRKDDWGQPLRVRVRRGLANPYTTHPRLDLFVGSLSPHNMSVFACTMCHEGQGSATAFKWASHTPNTPRQKGQWTHDYGWFDNPHWTFPMYPKRFAESSCLKCHHDVVELEPSERYPEPPAPKVVRGYNLISKYGCFGCHEVNGYDGPHRRIGPDLRLEPNYFAAALQLKHGPATGYDRLSDTEKEWIDQLIDHPERSSVRRDIHQMILRDAASESSRLSPYVSQQLEPLFRDVEAAGTMRRVGPSLRFLKSKVTEEFLLDWIRQPKHFRPDTRMPQFFGQWSHLAGASKELAQRYEPLEILGITTYLLDRSQAFTYLKPQAGVSATSNEEQEEQIGRGKVLFQDRGCLACHQHQAFADADAYRSSNEIIQGPNLSGITEKLNHREGRQWLYSWLKEPSRYHSRTLMPNLFLDVIEHKDKDGNVTKVTDPAADIVAFLLAESKSSWKPFVDNLSLAALESDLAAQQALDEMVLMDLKEAVSTSRAKDYLETGIPEHLRSEQKGAEIELVGSGIDVRKKLLYIGRKSIGRYGCSGCHDIPDFEGAKPIGTGLADWGRKDPARLAFNDIANYVEHQAREAHAAHPMQNRGNPPGTFSEQDRGFYRNALLANHRAGFIYQKLVEPRSFDYHQTENIRYNERLRMPQFGLNDEQREAVITFVLGLVAAPPAAKFVYQSDARQEAINGGRQVLAKYNCGGCHMLEMEKWVVSFPPGTFGPPDDRPMFPFLKPKVNPEQLASSAEADWRGRLHATLVGLPALDNNDGLPLVDGEFEGEMEALDPDSDYNPATLEYYFDLFEPVALGGAMRDVGVQMLRVPAGTIDKRYASQGGFLAKYLIPYVVQRDKERNAGAKARAKEAWGWLPPPLIGQGAKVQSDWLHAFLLDPNQIRPEVVLRMPKFNLSPEEATKLVNYFGAVDNVEYPYQFNNRTRGEHLAAAEAQYEQLLRQLFPGRPPSGSRFDHAMKIVTDKKNGCVQCHIVGDYRLDPKGPDLQGLYRRMRPDYLLRWLARPAGILPYTSMPDNFKYLPETPDRDGFVVSAEDGSSQKYVEGTSTQQLNAVVDLLMNFDDYSLRQHSIKALVEAHAPPVASSSGVSSEEAAATGP